MALGKPLERFEQGNDMIIFVFWTTAFLIIWRFHVKLEIKVTVINQSRDDW